MADEVSSPAPSGNSNKNIIMIFSIAFGAFLITVIIIGAILISYMKGISSGDKGHTANQAETAQEGKKGEVGPVISLGNEFIVNIVAEDGSPHFLKVVLSVELDNEKTKEEAEKRVPQMRDQVISILTSKTKEKISEKEGKELIRREITTSINRFLATGRIKNVYFEDFLIQ
jgi:flagellar FliL protein